MISRTDPVIRQFFETPKCFANNLTDSYFFYHFKIVPNHFSFLG